MVTDRPSGSVASGGATVASGGATARVGAACKAVVDRLAAADPALVPSVWLERGGRLRCMAVSGIWHARDGIPTTAGAVGRAFTSGARIVTGAEGDGTISGGAHGRICVPLRSRGAVVGVLDVRVDREPHDDDAERVRRAAAGLAARITALGGAPAESSAQRLLRHVARLAELEDAAAIAEGILTAALDLVPVDSGVVVRRGDGGALEPSCGAGPLARPIAATPPAGLDLLAGAVRHATSCFTLGATRDDAPAPLAALQSHGAQALVAVGLVTHGDLEGMLLLASRAPVELSSDDVELLELLAAQAASLLRTADLVRSLRERAATDPLTGLGHHRTFHESLAGSHRRPSTAVVLADIDGFKRLNDTFGHQHGDHVLRGVAAAMASALRRGDTLFRIGGDEFAALLAVSDDAEALEAGERLLAAVHAAGLGVTMSIGVAVPRDDDESDSALLARADHALYQVKDAGRDGVALAGDGSLPVAPAG